MRWTALCILLSLTGACRPAAPVTPPPAERSEPEAPPRLLVIVVYDQLGSDALSRVWPALDAGGALKRLSREGLYLERGRFPYAGTFTAPGHATIYTGAAPVESGVVSNQIWDYGHDRKAAAVDDGEHRVLGVDGAHAGPGLLAVETLGDALSRQTDGAAQVASLSVKDRAAIIGGGKRGDLVLWYESALPGFTTSSYYADTLPEWLTHFSAHHPLQNLLTPWEAEDAGLLAQVAGEDEAPGEGDYHGFATTFPHDPSAGEQPYAALRLMPALSERTIQLAEHAAGAMGLGADDTPDLLAVSLSGPDYVGHVFGTESWEYAEHMRQADRALAAWLAELDTRTRLAVVLTSDHGSAPLPERHEGGVRLDPGALAQEIDAVIDGSLGEGDWVYGYYPPFVYFTPALREHPSRAQAVRAAIAHVESEPGMAAAYDVHALQGGQPPRDALGQAVHLNLHESTDADLLLVPGEGVVVDPGMAAGGGTNHGTPHDYDRDVPVVFWGPGIDPARVREPVDMRRVAPSLAHLLGIAPPEAATLPPLPQFAER